MRPDVILTREIPPLPPRGDDSHKGDVGRIVIIGGCCDDLLMVGAPAMAASAALRGGAGLVQMFVPEPIRAAAATLAPCATARTLPAESVPILEAIRDYKADVVVVGPGLGRSLAPSVIVELLTYYPGAMVVDADALNLLAEVGPCDIPDPHRVVLTPHPGEMQRLLAAGGRSVDADHSPSARREAACALVATYGCTVVLKGRGTVVTNGDRLYVNETGNSGMATAGMGDVLTGLIAALIGQRMVPLEAAILGVYLHGLAGDLAADELGKHSLTALDVIDFLPEAFGDYALSQTP